MLDCVDHGIILSELKVCGINGKSLAIYKLYLHDSYIGTAIYKDSDSGDKVQAGETLDTGSRNVLLFLL